ncbi:hypothetical protein GCM10023116_32400 [Kistimonas scapharcae]|uniref:Lipoprotein n=1 Tax=Kistimonas scapharcae TaxID=1036133 RepID=A0ABP8V7P4_9GAMM
MISYRHPVSPILTTALASALIILLSGCTRDEYEPYYDAWNNNPFDCLRLPYSQQEECLKAQRMPYDDYMEERDKLLAPSSKDNENSH